MKLTARVYGEPAQDDRPELVILHGLFGSKANWHSLAKVLAESQRVHVLDMRNHGESPHSWVMNYIAMAADVKQYLQAQGLGSAVIIGHSMGGKAAMTLALRHPDVVKGLVVVDIAPVTYQHNFSWIIEPMRALSLDSLKSRLDADKQLSADVNNAGIRGFLLQSLIKDEGRWQWRINLDALALRQDDIAGFPIDPGKAVYHGETLFIGGKHSDYLQESYRPTIQSLFPRARMRWVDEAGHWVHSEQPKKVLELIEEFLM